MSRTAYTLTEPVARTSSVVFASPHSGCDYPEWFLRRTLLDEHTIRSSEDAYVDRLFGCVPEFGAPFLVAGAPRAMVDLNRGADELDPALINGVRRAGHNPRIASGLGVIPRVVANGRAIYRGKITPSEAERRIEAYWRPYHARLQRLLDDTIATFGQAILIDCHSMPREAVDGMTRNRGVRPDVVLGDRFGASASTFVVDAVEAAFATAGFKVARNAPFAGAYITQAYGRPARGQHVVQVELDRSLYMDEGAIAPHSGFDEMRERLRAVIGEITAIGKAEDPPLAAE